MTVTRIRAAIAEASTDKRVTEAEAKKISMAALFAADGSGDGVSTAEAKVLADFFITAQAPGAAVKLGAPAVRVFQSLFFSTNVPVGNARPMVTRTLQDALPFAPGPKLTRAPNVTGLFELPLGKDAELASGPERTAYLDPEKKRFFLKLATSSGTSWAGPIPMYRPATGSPVPQSFALLVVGGVKVTPTANASSFLLSGGIPAGGSLTLDLGNGTKVKVAGPKAGSYATFKAIDAALPSGYFATARGRFFEEEMNEVASTDSRVISLSKGDRPGELVGSDLELARTLTRQLAAVPQGAATAAAQRPAWSTRAGLFAADKGAGPPLFAVPLASGRIALVDPKHNQVFFAKPGAGHALSAVKGPVALGPLAFRPVDRFFTWKELKALSERATLG